MSPERWLPIPGYEGLYEVSDQGQVRSWRGRGVRGDNRRPEPVLLKPWLNPKGYQCLALYCADGQERRVRVHVVVALAFHGPRPDDLETRHLDGNQLNNSASNLAYGTRSQNRFDTVRHGNHPQASKTHCPRGHAYEGDNVVRGSRGGRVCRTCKRALARQASAARRMAGVGR